MEKVDEQNEESKGLSIQTVNLLREKLLKSYKLKSNNFTCFYNTHLDIGWIISSHIMIYNNKNVYFEIKAPSNIKDLSASQIEVINNESGVYIVIIHGKSVYSRKIDNEVDVRYSKFNLQLLDQEEVVACHHLYTLGSDQIPNFIVGTDKGRLISLQIYVDDDILKVHENLIEAPKRFLNSLTRYFTGEDVPDTSCRSIQSFEINQTTSCLLSFGKFTLNCWTLCQNDNRRWKMNIKNIFASLYEKYCQELSEIEDFCLIGEEIIDSNGSHERILKLVVKICTQINKNSKKIKCVYYYFPLHINVIAQTYKGYEPIKLREDDYDMKEDQVKCLVCSNESDSTYVFLCYPTETRCLSLVKDEMIENHLELNVLGYGTMINNNKVRTFLLFINNEILSFSLLREMSFEKLVRSYLTEIEENWAKRQKIQEANLESMAVDMDNDYEKRILDLMKDYTNYPQNIDTGNNDLYFSPQEELMKIKSEQGDEVFFQILKNLMHKLTEEMISDNMVCQVQREDVDTEAKYKSDVSGIIKWWIKTKITRLNSLKIFLETFEIDFSQELIQAEEKLIFIKNIREFYDELHQKDLHNITAMDLVNHTIEKVVRDYHKISKQELKRTGSTSAQIFYSYPLQLADKFIFELSRILFESRTEKGLSEDALCEVSIFVINIMNSLLEHRKENHNKPYKQLLWTMNNELFVDPLKRIIDLMPEIINNNSSSKLVTQMFKLSEVILLELESAAKISTENEEDGFQDIISYFEFNRNKLIRGIETFDISYAINLAVQFKDIINVTRLCIAFNNYDGIYDCIDKIPAREKSDKIFESMHWIVEATKEHMGVADGSYHGNIHTSGVSSENLDGLKLFHIYEDDYDSELKKFISEHYSNLMLIYSMRRGACRDVANRDYKIEYVDDEKTEKEVRPVVMACKELNEIEGNGNEDSILMDE